MQSAISSKSFSFPQLQSLALPGLFAWFGIVMGSWVSRIPALRDGLQLSHATLSCVLLCGGLGAVLSFPLTSKMMARFGGKRSLLFSGSALLVVLAGVGMAPHISVLMIAVLLLGMLASTFDVAVNSVATHIESQSGTSSMSRLHAFVCAGGLAGTLLGSLMADKGISPATHFMMLGVPFALILWFMQSMLQEDPAHGHASMEKKTFSLPRGPLALLGALGFLGAVAEGSIADWSGLFLKDHFQVSDAFAPLALSAFTTMMLLTRLAGDKLKTRHGARLLMTSGAVMAAVGLFLAVLATGAHVALCGFAIAGAGLALIFPFIFSAAGKEGPAALACVATMAYSGSLMGPPVIGSIAQGLGLQAAMGFVGVISLGIALVASRSKLLATTLHLK